MILIDMSNMVFNAVLEYHSRTKETIDEETLRHMIVTRISQIKKNLSKFDDGIIVLAYDSKNYWRRKLHPNYKGSRAKDREESAFDWNAFFPIWNVIKKEFEESLPFYSIALDTAEADDIIATLVLHMAHHHKICIVSSDEDFLQLQTLPSVTQYSIKNKKFITDDNYSLFEHIVKGDRSDGVPSILVNIDFFHEDNGTRQPSVTVKMLSEWEPHKNKPEQFCRDHVMLERYLMNKKLIDLREIPQELQDKIMDTFNSYTLPKGKVFMYCVTHQLTKFLKAGGF